MKNAITTLLLVAAFLVTGCQNQTSSRDKNLKGVNALYTDADTAFSKPITIDSANKMIQSYLVSINPTDNPNAIKSLIFDASVLRDYLNNDQDGEITHLKMVFAHTLDYINSGHYGQRPDSNQQALTLVLVGYGADENYIYHDGNLAFDFCQPCPRECPTAGSAANDLLTE